MLMICVARETKVIIKVEAKAAVKHFLTFLLYYDHGLRPTKATILRTYICNFIHHNG